MGKKKGAPDEGETGKESEVVETKEAAEMQARRSGLTVEDLVVAHEAAIPATPEEQQIDARSLLLIHLPAEKKKKLYKDREELNSTIGKVRHLHSDWGKELGLTDMDMERLGEYVRQREGIAALRPLVLGLLDALEDSDDLFVHLLIDHLAQIVDSVRTRGKRKPELLTAYEGIMHWWTAAAIKGVQTRKQKNKTQPPATEPTES